MDFSEVVVRPVERGDEGRYQEPMRCHHYLGALPKTGETLWYVATYQEDWVALASFSAAAGKCAVRDRWIGWDFRQQCGRLTLIANNSRFLILPQWHRRNLARAPCPPRGHHPRVARTAWADFDATVRP